MEAAVTGNTVIMRYYTESLGNSCDCHSWFAWQRSYLLCFISSPWGLFRKEKRVKEARQEGKGITQNLKGNPCFQIWRLWLSAAPQSMLGKVHPSRCLVPTQAWRWIQALNKPFQLQREKWSLLYRENRICPWLMHVFPLESLIQNSHTRNKMPGLYDLLCLSSVIQSYDHTVSLFNKELY